MRLIVLFFVICMTMPVFAQIFPQDQTDTRSRQILDPQNRKYQTSLEMMYRTKSLTRIVGPQVLEDMLDDSLYQIGPGDVFNIHIWGDFESEYEAVVNPQGSVILPTVGEVEVNGMILADARTVIISAVKQKYKADDFSINLIELRKFRVYITGEVTLPGTYFAQGSDRVSDILEVAEGVTDWANDNKIEVRHQDGTIDYIDLNQFFLEGDKRQNPFLRGGDVIYIPAIDVKDGYVIVEGNVEFEGSLEVGLGKLKKGSNASLFGVYVLKENERIGPFLRRIGALTKKADLRHLMVVRDDTEYQVNLLNQDSLSQHLYLQNGDRIIVPSIMDRVYVRGEVRIPGALPYYANQRAKDYVGRAGVLDSGAGPEDYVIIRHSTGEYLTGTDVIIESGDTIIVPTRGRYVLRDYLIIVTPILSFTATLLLLLTRL